jgi:hypothetical protein
MTEALLCAIMCRAAGLLHVSCLLWLFCHAAACFVLLCALLCSFLLLIGLFMSCRACCSALVTWGLYAWVLVFWPAPILFAPVSCLLSLPRTFPSPGYSLLAVPSLLLHLRGPSILAASPCNFNTAPIFHACTWDSSHPLLRSTTCASTVMPLVSKVPVHRHLRLPVMHFV